MGTAFLYGNGGGSDLNFKVVGGTSGPASPVENTIWVVTDAAISRWDFRAEGNPSWAEPEGTVFITSSTDPVNIHFNAIKNATKGIRIFLQLLGCIQYSAGAWRKREAYIYQGGVWKQFSNVALYLYNNGDQCTNVSGGWKVLADGSGSIESTCLRVKVGSDWSGAQISNNSSVNMTNYSKLNVEVANYNRECYLGINDTAPNNYAWNSESFNNQANCEAITTITANGTVSLDISSMSGSFYVWLATRGVDAGVLLGCDITKVWLS